MAADISSNEPAAHDDDHVLVVRKCNVVRGRLVPIAKPKTLGLDEAFLLLAPNQMKQAKIIVVSLKTGDYVGLKTDLTNFKISTEKQDGDIRWLLNKRPGFETSLKEIYKVESVLVKR